VPVSDGKGHLVRVSVTRSSIECYAVRPGSGAFGARIGAKRDRSVWTLSALGE
jgi:hypothetical protein